MDAANVVEIETFLRFLGRLHPAATHFPIALLIFGAVCEVAAVVMRRRQMSRVGLTCLVVGGIGAGVAAWFGWLMADYDPPGRNAADVLFWHRWVGIGVAVLAGVAILLRAAGGGRARDGVRHAYVGVYVLAAMLVGVSGYLGGEMVYGSNHIFEVFATPEEPSVTVAEGDAASPGAPGSGGEVVAVVVDEGAALLFTSRVLPALEQSCFHCHGVRRQKGSLRLDRPQDVAAVIVPGDSLGSVLFERISLPFDHPDLMPPDDERLPEDVVQAFRQWIDAGAPWVTAPEVTLDLPGPDAGGATAAEAPVEVDPAATSASRLEEMDRLLSALAGQGIRAVRLGPESTDVAVNLSLMGPAATDETLKLLEPVAAHVVRLDIGGTAVTDDGVAGLPRYPRLRRLQLQKTTLTDSGFRALGRLHLLEDLDCSETAITDASLTILRGLPALQRVRLWKTGVTAAGLEALAQERPELEVIVTGP